MSGPESLAPAMRRSPVERLEAALATRQEIVQELRCLAHHSGERARHRTEEVQAQLAQLTQELERLLVEIEHVMGPPAGPRLDEQEDSESGLMAG